MKTKIKSHSNEVADFYDKEIPKVDSNHTCLAIMNLDSALIKMETIIHKLFLKACKYIKKKVIRHIVDDLESSSDNSDEE